MSVYYYLLNEDKSPVKNEIVELKKKKKKIRMIKVE